MHVRIDPSSGVPIYQQIVGEFRLLIAGGVLSPGDRLPSVRRMAMDLRVNPNTGGQSVQRDGEGRDDFHPTGRGDVCQRAA